jgi:predicted MFS family arabinose efflux permease
VFFLGGLLTIVGPVAVGMIGTRFGSTRPLVLIGGLMCATAVALTIDGDALIYLTCVPLWMVLPAMLTPSFLGSLATIEPSGRLAGAQPAFAALGGAMGPMLAGATVDAGGFRTLSWFVASALLGALALMAIATLKADGMRARRPD